MKTLLGVILVGACVVPTASNAVPILATTSCDSSGLYTCLTRVENFESGGELYNADFIPGDFVTVFGFEVTTDPVLEPALYHAEIRAQMYPLETAIFWNDLSRASAFSAALANLLDAEDIDGFLCYSTPPCSSGMIPFDETWIPVFPAPAFINNPFEYSGCFISRFSGSGFYHCQFSPSSNLNNWAVITSVAEPATLSLLAAGLFGALAGRRRRTRVDSIPPATHQQS